MRNLREPILHPVPITALRPTQITVGMREVEAKRAHWRTERGDKAGEFLGEHMIPVIRGPKNRFYVIDHHHLSLALHLEGVKSLLVTVVADLHKLDHDAFWFYLDNTGMTHPYDAAGIRRPYGEIPKSIEGLVDDPYRSLAGELRRAGGYSKETIPFSEFLWADFLRRRVKAKQLDKDFERAVAAALELARGQAASYLPGWCGPIAG